MYGDLADEYVENGSKKLRREGVRSKDMRAGLEKGPGNKNTGFVAQSFSQGEDEAVWTKCSQLPCGCFAKIVAEQV